MSIKIACPDCGKKLTLADDLVGKKVRCKACDHRFKVRDPDRDDDDDQAESKLKKRRSRKSGKNSGVPIWVWCVCGGGAALVLVIVVVVIIVIVTSGPRRGEQAGNNRPKGADQGAAPNNQPLIPLAPPGPHAAIVEEFGTIWNNAASALEQARDEGSVATATAQLRQETTKLDQLTQRLRAAGRVPDADAAGVRAVQQCLEPNVPRLENEGNQLRQRMRGMNLSPQTAAGFDQAIQAFGASGKSFVSVARQNIP